MTSPPEELVVHNLSVRLGGRLVLDAVSLALRPGELTAVLGPNGAGKSTLLSAFAGLIAPASGERRLGGRELMRLPAAERARLIAVLPQGSEIAWDIDAKTLVRLARFPHRRSLIGGSTEEDDRAVERAMRTTETLEFANRVATSLSGGELTRVLLARALAGEPAWLLADEPLAGLDLRHQFDACDLLRRAAAGGRGVVLTLHDLSLAARTSDRIIVLSKGRVVADGPPKDVLSREILAQVFDVDGELDEAAGGLFVRIRGKSASEARSP